MKFALAAFGVAALVGVGYVIGRKVLENKRAQEEFYDLSDMDEVCDEDGECDVYAKSKSKEYGDKIRKASLFAVGAIKTSADKVGETITDIRTKDMVKKGEETIDAVKETGENIKNDIKRDLEGLKDMVSAMEDEVEESDVFEAVEDVVDAVDDIKDDIKDAFKNTEEE